MNNALRCIVIAYKDLKESDLDESKSFNHPRDDPIKDVEKADLTLVAVLGIEDTIRMEVPGAVKKIQNAGVTVRMVTGDHKKTAEAIGIQCNIIERSDLTNKNTSMKGQDFWDACDGYKTIWSGGKKKEVVKNYGTFLKFKKDLNILWRCMPHHKYLMVVGLKQGGDTVAVTGDGTNDAPALKKADVGFGMNIAGTDVCKDAADILLMKDDFSSVVTAALWGRNIYDNIQRFLRFQLTVNFVALTVTFIGSCIMKQSPLNAIQLLWVNLIMDSLAALALATEDPK